MLHERTALHVPGTPDPVADELLGDRGGKLAAVLAGDEVHHEVARGVASRAGDPVPIEDAHPGGDHDLRVVLDEGVAVIPLGGALVSPEDAALGEETRAGVDPAEYHVARREAPEPPQARLVHVVLDVVAGTHEDEIGFSTASIATSAWTRTPLLARTGRPSRLATCHR